jgi:type II secretory pathway pseudopilin PulG
LDTHPRLGRRSSRIPLLIAVIVAILMISTIVALAHKRRVEAEEARIREMTAAVTTLRNAIGDFRKQHGRYPRALSELGQVPRDPVTASQTTWQPEFEASVSVDDFTAKSVKPEQFVINVRSGAKGHDAHGRAWSDY